MIPSGCQIFFGWHYRGYFRVSMTNKFVEAKAAAADYTSSEGGFWGGTSASRRSCPTITAIKHICFIADGCPIHSLLLGAFRIFIPETRSWVLALISLDWFNRYTSHMLGPTKTERKLCGAFPYNILQPFWQFCLAITLSGLKEAETLLQPQLSALAEAFFNSLVEFWKHYSIYIYRLRIRNNGPQVTTWWWWWGWCLWRRHCSGDGDDE